MTSVAEHPSLRIARAFDEALTRAARAPFPADDRERGAFACLFCIADAAGLSSDPRVIAIFNAVRLSPVRRSSDPRGAA